MRRCLASALVIATAGVAACDTVRVGAPGDVPRVGGTLNIVLGVKVEHLDPQRMTSANDVNISRLYSRTLTTFSSEPDSGGEIVGDLATDLGRPLEGNLVWEFTLKRGIKWQDGSPITCEHIKYGVERNFSTLFTTGLSYPRQLLQDNTPPYQGPFNAENNHGKGLESVQCLDAKTIRFRLKRLMGDFGHAVALAAFAPVPPGEDGDKAAYDRQPFSSGPYLIDESNDERIVMRRNPHWVRATDPVRKAYPDRIVITVNPDAARVAWALVKDEPHVRNTVQLDMDLVSNFVQQVINDDALNSRLIQGPHTGVRWVSINTRRIPHLDCRKALVFAANKRRFRSALGGAVFGDIATSVISPSLAAYRPFDMYNARTHPEGDEQMALKHLSAGGDACPKVLRFAFPESRRRLAAIIADSFERIGIGVELVSIPPTVNYFADAVGDPHNDFDLMWAGWIADWASASAVIAPVFHGRVIPQGEEANGNNNLSLLDDPQINEIIDDAIAEADRDQQHQLWANLDRRIMALAPVIPLTYMNSLRMAGSNVRGGFIHPQYGAPDVTALGLADSASRSMYPDPAQWDRIIQIRDNLQAPITEAEREGLPAV